MLASTPTSVVTSALRAARATHAVTVSAVKTYCPGAATATLATASRTLTATADGARFIRGLASDYARANPPLAALVTTFNAPLAWLAANADATARNLSFKKPRSSYDSEVDAEAEAEHDSRVGSLPAPMNPVAGRFCAAFERAVAFPPAVLPVTLLPPSALSAIGIKANPPRLPLSDSFAVVAAVAVLLFLFSRLLKGVSAALGLGPRRHAKGHGPHKGTGVGARPNGVDRSVFLVDIATVEKFDPRCAVTQAQWFPHIVKYFGTEQEEVDFDRKILERSGISETTHLPLSILSKPPNINIKTARQESETVMFDVVKQLLDRNRIKPTDVDILVVNCSLFNPTPSHAAMIINHFKMRSDIVSYSLAGMGCSASVLATDLASDLLATSAKKDPIAIVVSFENLTQNLYFGKVKPMHLANVLFRMGGAAVMLTRSAKSVTKRHPDAKWRLNTLVRVHIGADDAAYQCVFQDCDDKNLVGVSLSKDVPRVATRALTLNMSSLGHRILPLSAKLAYAAREVMRSVRTKLFRLTGGSAEDAKKRFPPTVPNFKAAVDYFCIHAGGRAVIDGIKDTLSLTEKDVEASRSILYKYGNTSSSSIWYEFQFTERNNRVTKGQKLWQIAFGSGFKCNSAVWEKL